MLSVLERTNRTLEGFEREEFDVNGVKTVVYQAGRGEPVVFLHGAGTFTGFGFAKSLAERFRVIIPYHPGFGESGDDPTIDTIQDYVLHYLDLFDALDLRSFRMIGLSFGGWLAAEFAILEQERLEKLVLIAPSGLALADPPAADLFKVRPADLPGYLVQDPAVLKPFMPEGHDLDFLTLRYRETTSMARLVWEQPAGNRKLAQWLHRIRTPTLLVWGDKDRLRPYAHAASWLDRLPNARLETVAGAGHLVLDEKPDTIDAIAAFLA
jgi:pimeloyl-ACP methyl ester carboxylesterase